MRVALDRHERREPDRAELRHPADVVPAQVHQHQVLGPLLGVGRQLVGERGILLAASAPRGRVPAIGRSGHLAVLHPDQDLRRAADDVDVVAVEVVEVRRRIERAEIAVGQERVRRRRRRAGGDSTVWKVSPAAMYSLIRRTSSWNRSSGYGEPACGQRRIGGSMASGRIVPGAASRSSQSLDPRLRAGVQPAQLRPRPRRRHLDVRDDRGAIEQVVEHQQGVGHHHDGVGQIPVVGRRRRAATRWCARCRSPR